MYAILKEKASAGLDIKDVPIPIPKDDEVLIKVKAASICGTDVHIFDWHESVRGWMNPPVIIGHEFTGNFISKVLFNFWTEFLINSRIQLLLSRQEG